MGCNTSSEKETPGPTTYSWDREDRPDPKDFTIADKTGGIFGRLPGKINGQQFIIENCKDTTIYLFDFSATITIERCENCNIFIGPSKGSVFIRNSNNCLFYIACQQFRTRDCRKLELYLLCDTQPIIETSAGLKFGCFQIFYPEIEQQFKNAELSLYNNLWYKIHDFTPLDQGSNFSFISAEDRQYLPISMGEDFDSIELSYETENSIVPLTRGKNSNMQYDDSCLVVFFYTAKDKCKNFLKDLAKVTNFDLIQSKEIQLTPEDVTRIFKNDKYSVLAKHAPLIGLELNGVNVIRCGEEVLEALGITMDYVYISVNQATAKQDIDAFYNFVDMSMI